MIAFPVSRQALIFALTFIVLFENVGRGADGLPDTLPWTLEGDPADAMLAGLDQFLLKELSKAPDERRSRWRLLAEKPDRQATLNGLRQRLRECLGIRDPMAEATSLQIVRDATPNVPPNQFGQVSLEAVRWEVVPDVWVEGLLARPTDAPITKQCVLIPDASQSPEDLFFQQAGDEAPVAWRLAQQGCQVLICTLIRRNLKQIGNAELTQREYLYRAMFGLGRHPLGYEVQTVLAGLQCLRQLPLPAPILAGWGEGGRVALYASAVDGNVPTTVVSGVFGPRESLWQEPLDRNLFGVLKEFGDGELAALIAPHRLHIEASAVPHVVINGKNAAPGALRSLEDQPVASEIERAKETCELLGLQSPITFIAPDSPQRKPYGAATLQAMLVTNQKVESGAQPTEKPAASSAPELPKLWPDAKLRQERLVRTWDRYSQQVLEESPYVRAEFMKGLDTKSLPAFEQSSDTYRQKFYNDVIGRFENPLLDPQARSRKLTSTEKWDAYEVQLQVWEDVFAYGILLMPKGIPADQKRPVVVCQHGLEGRPQDTIFDDHPAYHNFAAQLCEEGFIVFAPQNPYLFYDRFRTLQRKANPLGKSLFSLIVPQHQQIVNWLGTLPMVDAKRIGFYGLSYGGKSAMRIPALVPEYSLSICSADFNDWVWKLSSTRSTYSYVRTPEYEIFEYNLGSTFNYSEMAALIAPRPFMVERGHFDGVAPDDRVAAEFARVRYLYAARLNLSDRCEIEWFVGPHTINGKKSFEFLRKHLRCCE